MRTGWELFGRDGARAEIAEVVSGAGAASLVVHGPAGIGKSRLVDDVVGRLAPDALRIRASAPLRHMPLGALALAAPGAVVGAGDRRSLVESATSALESSSPPAVWVDDAHHLDAESAAVVLHLVTQQTAPVLLTIRDGEPVLPPVAALAARSSRLALGPLDARATADLAAAILGGPVAEPSLRRLHRRSGGNPLLLRELIRSGLATGEVAERGGLWHVAHQSGTPTGLEDLVADHALGRSAEAVDLFRHLAVADHLAEPAAVKLGSDEAIAELIDAGLVARSTTPPVLRPDHPLFAEVVLARLDPDDRRAIAARLADAVEALDHASETGAAAEAGGAGPSGPDEIRAVRWRLEAGAPVAPTRALAVAWLALSVFDLDLAVAAASSALESGEASAALPMATALAYRGEHAAAVPYFERAAGNATGEWDRAFALLAATLNAAYVRGWGPWVADSHRRNAASVTDPSIRQLLRSEETSALAFAGLLDEAVALGDPEVLDTETEPAAALPFVPGWASARTAQGATSEVIAALSRLEATVTGPPDRSHAWLFAFRAQAEVVHGRLLQAETAMATFDETAASAMVEDVAAVLSAEMRGIIALERGDLGAALRWLSEAVALSEAPEARFRRVVPWGFLAVARGLAGDAQGAATAAQETADAAALFPLAAGYAGRAAAWARVGAGDLTGAARAATAAAEANEAAGTRTTALWCAHDALRFAPGPSTAARVIELAVGVDGARAHAFTVHARAVVDTDPGALIAAADAFEALDARVHAAEVLELAATQLRADGLRDSARRAATRASALRDACGVAHSGGSLATDDLALASLTRREREAAALAASGLTNAQLAERLGVSVRTAEGHLANAMAKLDVSRRTELAGRLHVDRRSNADNA